MLYCSCALFAAIKVCSSMKAHHQPQAERCALLTGPDSSCFLSEFCMLSTSWLQSVLIVFVNINVLHWRSLSKRTQIVELSAHNQKVAPSSWQVQEEFMSTFSRAFITFSPLLLGFNLPRFSYSVPWVLHRLVSPSIRLVLLLWAYGFWSATF